MWLIRKDQLDGLASGTPVTPVALMMSPPTGHFYARWEDADGISVVWEGMDLMDLGFYLQARRPRRQRQPRRPGHGRSLQHGHGPRDDRRGAVRPRRRARPSSRGIFNEDWTFNLQLSAMDWSTEGMTSPDAAPRHLSGLPTRATSPSERPASTRAASTSTRSREETPGALCSFERGSMELKARWEYPDLGDHITSPTFAPRNAGSDASRSAYAGRRARRPRRLRRAAGAAATTASASRSSMPPNVGAGPIAVLDGDEPRVRPAGAALGVDAGVRTSWSTPSACDSPTS